MPSLTGVRAGTPDPNEWNDGNDENDRECTGYQTQYGWWWGGDEWHEDCARPNEPCPLEVELEKSGRESATEGAPVIPADLVPDPPRRKPWSESAVAKLMQNIGQQQLGKSMNAKHLGAAKIAHSRGTALRAPAKKFFVARNSERATAQLSHIAKKKDRMVSHVRMP